MLQAETLVQEGGSRWRLYTTPNAHVVLTGRGRQLLAEQPGVLPQLRNYRQAILGVGRKGLSTEFSSSRQHIASGGNSDVYSLTASLAIKEATNTQSLWFALERMDRLYDVMEKGVPRWIDMPVHYGLLMSRELERQYMLMQRIDGGVTVEDVLQGAAPRLKPGALDRFGDITDQQREDISSRFDRAGRILTDALVSHGMEPDQYMPDWHEGNVLLEPLQVPIGGSPYRMWVIDQ